RRAVSSRPEPEPLPSQPLGRMTPDVLFSRINKSAPSSSAKLVPPTSAWSHTSIMSSASGRGQHQKHTDDHNAVKSVGGLVRKLWNLNKSGAAAISVANRPPAQSSSSCGSASTSQEIFEILDRLKNKPKTDFTLR
ncbi:unnamed protein product, partial [Amoebophrya sp. A120]